MNKIIAQLIETRHITPAFLHPKYEDLADPFLLPDMSAAVERLKKAIDAHEKILIYGDYDVDGVTASTVMEQALRLAGVQPENIDIMLPDRFADGYGMSPKLIKHAEKQGATLVITVDCGSNNHAIVEELNTLGIDAIITDHHETPAVLPEAIAVINPKRPDYTGPPPLKELAGVGVAFKFAQALVSQGLIPSGQEKWLLDLVLLGTTCDCMLQSLENRILGYYGLKVLAKTRRPGLTELLAKAGVKTLNSEAIGFQIGPRLNAAGRLGTATLSLELLRCSSPVQAPPLVKELESLNTKRKTEQNTATQEIKARGISDDPVIIATGKWHEGILGIVAGHLVEAYHRPAFVLAEVENGTYKGSGRSFGDFNLAAALDFSKDFIINGGGHASAAGVKVDSKNLYQFRERINEYYRSLKLSDQERYFGVHADLALDDFSDIGLDLIDELRQLEPFGPGNEEPIFRLRNVQITKVTRMGGKRNHLRLDLKDCDGKFLKLVAFFAPERWLDIDPQLDHIEPLVKFIENRWDGITTIEARIVDIDFLT